jgi:hypothetical protein
MASSRSKSTLTKATTDHKKSSIVNLTSLFKPLAQALNDASKLSQ